MGDTPVNESDGMADSIAKQASEQTSQEACHRLGDARVSLGIDLQYPPPLLEASLHTLLAHSVTSSERRQRIMPQSETSLSDSWTSLSEVDYTQDDDLRSETTDAGSLLDLNATDDGHSVQGEPEVVQASGTNEQQCALAGPDLVVPTLDDSGGNVQDDGYDLIVPTSQPTAIPLDTSTETVIYSDEASISSDRYRSKNSEETGLAGNNGRIRIHMPMAEAPVRIGQKPFHILCLSSHVGRNFEMEEVLKKIGAALAIGQTHVHSLSACYHIVPSEIGPFSKPETSDLIPVPTQMVVHDANLVIDHQSGEARLVLPDRTKQSVTDQRPLTVKTVEGQVRTPDLLLILLTEDLGQSNAIVQSLVRCAQHGSMPVIAIQKESHTDPRVWSAMFRHENHLYKTAEHPAAEVNTCSRYAIEFEEFVGLDTTELSRHVQFLLQESEANRLDNVSDTSLCVSDTVRESVMTYLLVKAKNRYPILASCQKRIARWCHVQSHLNMSPSMLIAACLGGVLAIMIAIATFRGRGHNLPALPANNGACTSASVASIAPVGAVATLSGDKSLFDGFLRTDSQKRDIRKTANWSPKQQHNFAQHKKAAHAARGSTQHERLHQACRSLKARKVLVEGTLYLPETFFEPNPQPLVSVRQDDVGLSQSVRTFETSTAIRIQPSCLGGTIYVALESHRGEIVCAEVDTQARLLEPSATKGFGNGVKCGDLGSTRVRGSPVTLLHLSRQSSQPWHNLDHLKQIALRPVSALSHSVEKNLVRQGRACYQGNEDCILSISADLSQKALVSARKASEKALEVVDETRKALSGPLDNLYDLWFQAGDMGAQVMQHQQYQVTQYVAAAQARAQRRLEKTQAQARRQLERAQKRAQNELAKAQKRAQRLMKRTKKRAV